MPSGQNKMPAVPPIPLARVRYSRGITGSCCPCPPHSVQRIVPAPWHTLQPRDFTLRPSFEHLGQGTCPSFLHFTHTDIPCPPFLGFAHYSILNIPLVKKRCF